MAAPATLPALLDSLTQSLNSAQEVAPKLSAIERPKDGISLLDVKNELLLSYLQNLVFLILLKLRNAKNDSEESGSEIDEAVRSKLVELRLFLEKGARPLEEKLRFSIERFLQKAQDAQLGDRQKKQARKINGKAEDESTSESSAEEESEEEESDSDADEEEVKSKHAKHSAAPGFGSMRDDVTAPSAQREDGPGGVYRPPRRERHVMETGGPRDRHDRQPLKSHTMDEFVASELASAPQAEPSIGTTIVNGGRKMKTASERADEAERQTYEETNFVRLPKESKKDRAKKNKQAGRSGRMDFGGEEWHNLGEGVDRIDRLTKRREGGKGANVRAMLEKSRKRGADTVDGPRGSGAMGERFQKRVKMLDAGRRDRGKNR